MKNRAGAKRDLKKESITAHQDYRLSYAMGQNLVIRHRMLYDKVQLREGESMGYRSDVAYTIRFTDTGDNTLARQSFYTFLAEAKANPDTAGCFTEEESHYLIIDEEKMQLNFYIDYVKWYPEYPDVKCHNQLVDLVRDWIENKDAEGVIGYMFCRIGEESNDIDEHFGGNWDSSWVNLVREIEIDWTPSSRTFERN